MKRFIYFTNIIIIGFLFFSCSKSSESLSKKVDVDPLEITSIMSKQKFKCSTINGGSCPSGVAKLIIVDKSDSNKSAGCSGFMISENQLVTNHHCVPDEKSCADTFIAIYDGVSYLSTRCQSIVKTKQDFDDTEKRKVDFTILEVKDTFSGDTFHSGSEVVREGDKLTTWVIDHLGLSDSRITELECSVKDVSDKSIELQPCSVIHGNSGSPLLNSRGNITGVIWGGSVQFDSSTSLKVRRSNSDSLGIATAAKVFLEN